MRHRPLSNIAGFALLLLALLLAQSEAALAQNKHTLALFMSSSHATLQGFVRIINHSEDAGEVTIHAVDDDGDRFGPVTLSLGAKETQHFNSNDLRDGAPDKGLTGSIADGEGNWRLELETSLDIEPLAYTRPKGEGFLTSTHDVALNIPGVPPLSGDSNDSTMRWHVPIFNPGGNADQQSWLRVVNISGIDTEVEVEGLDDDGAPGTGVVSFALPADEALTLSAQELEQGSGDSEFDGQLGNGTGKWQLLVSADRPVLVMSLLLSQSGNLTNLSTVTGDHTIRGGPGPDRLYGGNGDDVLNPGDNSEGFDAVLGSAGDDTIVYSDSGIAGSQELNYYELDSGGITVTIDGVANSATVNKGSSGTDTIVDIENPLNAGGTPPYLGGFNLLATRFDDVFDVTLELVNPKDAPAYGQWMAIEGRDGNDTFNIGPDGYLSILYEESPSGVTVNLDTGITSDDGYGDTDIINGDPFGVSGSSYADTLRGSDRNETFYGRGGDDTIDGGGGWDRLRFAGSRFRSIGDLNVDLEAGTVTGIWEGTSFTYTISNIEDVEGQDGDDTLFGDDNRNILGGGAGDDVINPRGAYESWDTIRGSVGNDRIIYTDIGDDAYQDVNYVNLETGGITVRVDAAANQASVDKGAGGTDTIIDVVTPVSDWGFGVFGTKFDDVYHVDLLDDQDQYQYMDIQGRAGNDTFNIEPNSTRWYGGISIVYWDAPSGVNVDLVTGRVEDGYGTVDTINGDVSTVYGSPHQDVIRGRNNDEEFRGVGGDDTIDGGGGFDLLSFGGSVRANSIQVDLGAGTASGSRLGKSFTYSISNIEYVSGGPMDDRFSGSYRDERFRGRGGDDLFILEGSHGNDTITDFDEGDTLVLLGLGVSKSQVMNAAASDDTGDGTRIDLRQYGGGTINLWGFPLGDLDASDFLL